MRRLLFGKKAKRRVARPYGEKGDWPEDANHVLAREFDKVDQREMEDIESSAKGVRGARRPQSE